MFGSSGGGSSGGSTDAAAANAASSTGKIRGAKMSSLELTAPPAPPQPHVATQYHVRRPIIIPPGQTSVKADHIVVTMVNQFRPKTFFRGSEPSPIIRFTLDGSVPSALNGHTYDHPVVVTSATSNAAAPCTVVVKAAAYHKSLNTWSDVRTSTYRLNATKPAPSGATHFAASSAHSVANSTKIGNVPASTVHGILRVKNHPYNFVSTQLTRFSKALQGAVRSIRRRCATKSKFKIMRMSRARGAVSGVDLSFALEFFHSSKLVAHADAERSTRALSQPKFIHLRCTATQAPKHFPWRCGYFHPRCAGAHDSKSLTPFAVGVPANGIEIPSRLS